MIFFFRFCRLDQQPASKENDWYTSPYPEGAVFDKRDQSKKVDRLKVDPRDTSIILFPVNTYSLQLLY